MLLSNMISLTYSVVGPLILQVLHLGIQQMAEEKKGYLVSDMYCVVRRNIVVVSGLDMYRFFFCYSLNNTV